MDIATKNFTNLISVGGEALVENNSNVTTNCRITSG